MEKENLTLCEVCCQEEATLLFKCTIFKETFLQRNGIIWICAACLDAERQPDDQDGISKEIQYNTIDFGRYS